jgi:hypothetical protein
MDAISGRGVWSVHADEDRSPERTAVVAVLRAHGLTGSAIAQLWTLSRDMRRRTRRRGLEYAAMVNLETGITVGPVISGSDDSVDLRRHIAALVPGRRYVQIHTHPGSTSFSHRDVAMLLSWAQIHVMVVVGVDSTWYVLSRVGALTASASEAADAFLIELDRVEDERPGLSLQERTHRVWLAIAGRLGLRYDRVKRSES